MSGAAGPWLLTILRASRGLFATKRFTWDATLREWRKIDYSAGAWFYPEERPIASLRDLTSVLEDIISDPRAFIVRGELADGTREALMGDPELRIRRRKNGEHAALIEADLPWLMIDIDRFPLRAHDDLITDPESAIEHAIAELLPPPFHDAECFWQLSSAAGFKEGILKVHLFFWLTEPASNVHIKRVLRQHAPTIDRSPFNAAQPHYIAAPIVEGGPDPIPRRTGWRKGGDEAVTLQALRPGEPRRQGKARASSSGSTVEAALEKLGDGEGLDGFHAPLLAATLAYARRCARYGNRDDEGVIAELCAAIDAAPRRPDRDQASTERYKSDQYLQRIIDGAFEWLAGNDDAPKMAPGHSKATGTAEAARAEIHEHVEEFFERAHQWHATADGEPQHAGLTAGLGLGKSSAARHALPGFIARQQARKLPHRVLWAVPTHKLGGETLAALDRLGVSAAAWRGRDADDPEADQSDVKMCLAREAVRDAIRIGEDVEKSVCGNPDGDCCPFYRQCGYQRQKAAVASADVVIAAHATLFRQLPKIIREENLAAVVTDESWWQNGIDPGRDVLISDFADSIVRAPVLRDPATRYGFGGKARRRKRNGPRTQVADQMATSELHELATKAQLVFAGTACGELVSRAAVVAAGLTADDCVLALKHEWRRKVLDVLRPGMAPEAREEAVRKAAVNATLARRAGIWRALRELLESDQTHSGRLEIGAREDASGLAPVVLLHSRRDLTEAVTALPILMLDATMPVQVVRYFLPRLEVVADVQAATPHLHSVFVRGGWGKTTLVPHFQAGEAENNRREGLLSELADFVALNSAGSGLVATYQDCEDRFAGLPGVHTGHFNAIGGLDSYGQVNAVFVIGRPMPPSDALRRMALALTGRPVPVEIPHTETLGQLMADGTGVGVKTRAYFDPDLEALRAAITDTEVLQAAGRGRAVNRGPDNPLLLVVMANVVLPLPADRVVTWDDIRPDVHQRMAARGVWVDNANDAARLFPGLFHSPQAAGKSFQRARSRTFPYGYSLYRGMSDSSDSATVLQARTGRYQPTGNGQKTRTLASYDWRVADARAWLESRLGKLALFELDAGEPAEPDWIWDGRDWCPPPPPVRNSHYGEPRADLAAAAPERCRSSPTLRTKQEKYKMLCPPLHPSPRLAVTYLEKLNPAQRRAAEHGIGHRASVPATPLLVIAGAGSGKTNTLAHRVAHLIVNGVDPGRILLMTFSRRAAAEMSRRAGRICSQVMGTEMDVLVWAGPFHAMGARLLREYAEQLGIDPAFTIHDRGDSADLMNLVRHELALSQMASRFPAKATCLAIYSRAVNAELPLEEVLRGSFPWCTAWERQLRELFAAYVDAKQAQSVLDYDDLLVYWAQTVSNPVLAADMSARFDHVLVDEYQDTNRLQASILLALKPDGAGLTVVGDDAQSIYSFRAATVRNILDFPQMFNPPAEIVMLDRNYRSTQPILAAANGVIELAAERFTKNLWTDRESAERPCLITVRDETDQARYIIARVLENREEGLSLKQQAVLFRASHHSTSIEIELTRRNIPFVKFGGLKFLDTSHVKDLLAFLRFVENPRDRVAGFRVMQLLPGIGPVAAQRALDSMTGQPSPLRALANIPAPSRTGESWHDFVQILETISAGAAGWPAEVNHARHWYEPHLQRIHEDASVRQADLLQLEQIAAGYPSRARFLTELTLDPPDATSDQAGVPILDEDYLILSTIHSAKGQEWKSVFVLNVVDGCIPSDLGTGTAAEIDEERRLLYVAMTRAKDSLYLVVPQRFFTHGQSAQGDRHVYASRSRFIPAGILPLFECTSWPVVVTATSDRGDARQVRLDIGARMRSMWQ